MSLRKRLIIGLLLWGAHFFGQLNFSGFSKDTDPFSAVSYGESFTNVYYDLFYVKDKKSNKKEFALCVLQVGEKYSFFSDKNRMKYDSIFESSYHKNHEDIAGLFNELRKVRIEFKPFVLKQNEKDSITIQNRLGKNYQYSMKQPSLSWKIHEETKEISGEKVRKATTDYAGRKYIAWFSESLNLDDGPYVFRGLPGLILELYDTDKHYHFTMVGIDNTPQKIYMRNESKIEKVSPEKYRKIERNFHENPAIVYGQAKNEDGSMVSLPSKPYNPIELK